MPSSRAHLATDYVYVWADGVHLRIRLEEAKAAVLVLMGVRADGTKELIAMSDGYRESSEAWAGLLRDCARRGMRAPVLAVGDGALGFWNALSEVFPTTRHQRCWVHKSANCLDALPKSAQPAAKRAIQDLSSTFEKLMLDTVEGHLEAGMEPWRRLLATPVSPQDEADTRSLGLVRVLLLEPESGVAEATEEFLSANPDHEEITDALAYLTELTAVGDGVADRARQCRQLIVERAAE